MIFERPEDDNTDNESQYTDYPVEPERQGEGEEGDHNTVLALNQAEYLREVSLLLALAREGMR